MLPLLLGLGGSALGGAGLLGAGIGALGAGAIGSGLGSYLETGDLGKGVQTGLLSYFGGKALGGMFGGGADAAASAANPADKIAGLQTGDLAKSGMAATSGLEQATQASAPGIFSDPTAAMTAKATGSTLGQAMSASAPYTLSGAAVGALPDLLAPPKMDLAKSPDFDNAEADALVRERFTPPDDFTPGMGGEFDYFGPVPFYGGGLTALKYQEGGAMPEVNDKELINNAVNAIEGRTESPEIALAAFVARYGEEALRDLVDRVRRGDFAENAMVDEGMVRGVGDGMDDMIPATLEGEQDVVLSDGEFIVPADVVSGLGNGSSDAGSKALHEMMDRVRKLRTGKDSQPDQVPQEKMLPV